MKKLLSLVLSLTIVAALSLTLVACSGNSDEPSNADTGFSCSVVQDKTAGDGYLGFATVKKYVLTEEQSKAVSKGNGYILRTMRERGWYPINDRLFLEYVESTI